MKKIKNKSMRHKIFNKMSVKKRLTFYFIISVLIPTALISFILYNNSKNIIMEKMDSSIEKNLNAVEAIIQQKIDTVKDISTLIIFNLNSTVVNVLKRTHPVNNKELVEEIIAIDKILSYNSLQSISNLTNVGVYPRIYINDRPEYESFGFSDKVFDLKLIEDKQWVQDFPDGIFPYVGTNSITISNIATNTIQFSREVYHIETIPAFYCGILTIDIEVKYFNNILNNFKPFDESIIFVVDNLGTLIMSNTQSMFGENISKTDYMKKNTDNRSYYSYKNKIDGKEMFISVKNIHPMNWDIITLTPVKEMSQELVSFRKIVFLVVLISMCISFLTILLLASYIANPIQKLVKSMSHVKDGNFEIDIVYNKFDEFTFLIKEYIRMINKIKMLINKLYISELDKQKAELRTKDAELKMLQSQINPHFLYNTLDSVNWLAIKHNAPDISTMIKSLSNFFRYGLSNGDSVILWGNEIIQVESYLQIQKVRFRDKLEYSINVCPEILSSYTVKLILQPIVENAILHGIEKRIGKGKVTIKGEINNSMIEIRISDNGVGTNVDRLNCLLKDENDHSTSFGLKNVNLRIKQFWGREFGLEFLNNEDGGVTVIIVVPIVTRKEGQDA